LAAATTTCDFRLVEETRCTDFNRAEL